MKSAVTEISIASLDELRTFADEFAKSLKLGDVVGCRGDLGAGKTTFIKALCQALGVPDGVTSPTYTLEHRYRSAAGSEVSHWDLYRVSSAPEELLELCDRRITLIEWPERDPLVLGALTTEVVIEIVSSSERKITYRRLS